MLPYDGITRTGSEGMSHSVKRRPLASHASYWKAFLKASEEQTLSIEVTLAILRDTNKQLCSFRAEDKRYGTSPL